MNEKQKQGPEKKPRSIGSFLLFLFLLVAVLGWIGGQSMVKPDALSQDEYLANLYLGRISEQVYEGGQDGSRIKGTYVRTAGEKPVPFTVNFGSVESNEVNWSQQKAVRIERTIPSEDFTAALAGGWYDPVQARSIIERRVTTTPPPTGADPNAAPKVTEEVTEHLIVQVRASSEIAWQRAATDPTAQPKFYLPPKSRHMWLEIDLSPVPGRDVPELAGLMASLESKSVPISMHAFELGDKSGSRRQQDNSFVSQLLFYYGPWLLLGLLFFFFMRQARNQSGGGMMSFGKSRAQLYTKENHTGVTFNDVAGAAEAKAEVREIVEFLRNPARFTKIGGRIPRGILLVGSPGCGKTLLAKAIAGEAEVPFFAISGSDFVEMFVGVGASRVRDLFKQARENSPCIVFLDEIDAVGRRRGGGMGGGHDEREQTLNAILVEMDGFGTGDGIILLAATNRPDVLDPALLRPGRFDREVTIEMPDQSDREKILEVHLAKVRCEAEIDVELLARSSPGSSGADLAAIVNEAAIMAVLDNREKISQDDLEEARDKVRYGRKKINRTMEEEDLTVTAYHEAGHAVVAAAQPDGDQPSKITIIPRGRALGTTMVLPKRETHHQQRRRLMTMLAVAFGGRVAEELFCGDISAGAHSDIERATQIARSMVTELGMSEKVGPINYASRQGSEFLGTELMRDRNHSEETARLIDSEVKVLIDEAYAKARALLIEHTETVEVVTQALLKFETIDGKGIQEVMNGAPASVLEPVKPEEPKRETPPQDGKSKKEKAKKDRPGDLPGTAGFSPA